MPNLHPFVVHFPIALLTASFLFDIFGTLAKRDQIRRIAWWCQVAGTLGLLATVLSGLHAETTIQIPAAARQSFQTHKEVAFFVSAIFAILFFWRIGGKSRITQVYHFLFWGLYTLGLILLWVAAWHGGELVYRFGVGVQPVMP